jgi:hypothetical protein
VSSAGIILKPSLLKAPHWKKKIILKHPSQDALPRLLADKRQFPTFWFCGSMEAFFG